MVIVMFFTVIYAYLLLLWTPPRPLLPFPCTLLILLLTRVRRQSNSSARGLFQHPDCGSYSSCVFQLARLRVDRAADNARNDDPRLHVRGT